VAPSVEVSVSVPLLQLPGMDDELTGGTTPLEPGAAGMLQVCTSMRFLYIAIHADGR
jgi:hypothetical protein